jgi:hypothetical protein
MESRQIIPGILVVVFVFGAYFLGLFQGPRQPARWREFLRDVMGTLTWRGVLWAIALPVSWIIIYYGFIAHVWLSLGRWPGFGERIEGALLSFHYRLSVVFFGALIASLYALPIVLLGSLCLRRWRHVAVYALCYGAALGFASGALFLAPRAFLNWLLD